MNTTSKRILYYILTALERILLALVVIIAFVNVVMFAKSKIFNDPAPTFLGYSYVNVLSGSMEPTFYAGDLAVCKEQDTYEEGDAVLFDSDGYLILHRIIEVNEDGTVTTQGDANNVADEAPVPVNHIHGKLAYIFPGRGETLAYLTSGIGALWAVLATLFAFLALDTGRELVQEAAENGGEPIDAQTTVGTEEETNQDTGFSISIGEEANPVEEQALQNTENNV